MKIITTICFILAGFVVQPQQLTQITNNLADDWDPHWSPDGEYFCFTSGRSGHNEIWKITSDGQISEQLTFDNVMNMHPNWSPIGDYIAYDSEKSGNQDVWILPLDGGEHIQITNHPLRDESLCWNHDGTEIIFDSNRSSGNWDIWKKSVSGGSAVRLTNHPAIDIEPSASPNGDKIAFISFRTGDGDIWMMDADGSNQVQITNDSFFEGGICWSPDGAFLAYFVNNGGNFDIWILQLDGGEPIQFTNHPAADLYPSWSPDGSSIAFSSNRSGNNELWTKGFSSWPYLGQTPPGLIPERFPPEYLMANEEWFWHGPPVFPPNGWEFFMSRYYPGGKGDVLIYSMQYTGQEWTTPAVPGFCGDYNCNSPVFTSSGDTLFFTSERPETKIYYSTKVANNWSDPVEVNIPVPAQSTFGNSVSVAKNGTLYFELEISGDLDLYQSTYINGQYLDAVNLGASINSDESDFGPYIDPDEQYIIFSSHRNGGFGESDLYISTKSSADEWTAAQNPGNIINSDQDDFGPMVTSDGKYFFFCSLRENDEGYNPYWVDVQILDPFLITGIDEKKCEIQLSIWPNPFTSSTTIEYQVLGYSTVSIKIFDLYGKELTSLSNCIQTAGSRKIIWNGIDGSGNYLPSGIYILQLILDEETISRKLIINR